jgi:hypothetical protein
VVAKGAATMDVQVLETTLKAHISEMQDRLDQAAGIGKAAKACAENFRGVRRAIFANSPSGSSAVQLR